MPQGFLHNDAGRWYARWKHKGVPRARSLGTSDRREAERRLKPFIATVIASIHNGTYAAEFGGTSAPTPRAPLLRATANGDMSLGDVWPCYLGSSYRKAPGAATQEQYALQFGRFMGWMSEKHPEVRTLKGVTNQVASDFMNELRESRTANTFNKYRDLLARVHRVVCTTRSFSIANPFENIPPMDNDSARREDFTQEQKETILSRAAGEMLTLFYLGFYVAQRLKDCCLLDWTQVRMDANEVEVAPFKTRGRSKSKMVIPMHPDLKIRLSEVWEQAGKPASGHVLPGMAELYLRGRDNVTDRIQAFLRSLGLTP